MKFRGVYIIHKKNVVKLMMKSFESNIRSAKGDILDDLGFHYNHKR